MTPSSSSPQQTRRMNDLLGMRVELAGGGSAGYVNDVRLRPGAAVHGLRADLVVDGLVVDGRHAGSLLGYDRRSDQGPWVLRTLVRALHRNAGYAEWTQVRHIDWEERRIQLAVSALQPLTS